MPNLEIKHRVSGAVIVSGYAKTLPLFLAALVRRGIDLCGANLCAADLRAIDLKLARLRFADLRAADVRVVDFSGSDLRMVDMSGANARGTNFRGANMGGADVRLVDFAGADLTDAFLRGVKHGWTSHVLCAEMLRQAAGGDLPKLKFAGLVLISADLGWCWHNFMLLRDDPLFEWAIDVLAQYVTDGDNAPGILRERAARLKTVAEPAAEVAGGA